MVNKYEIGEVYNGYRLLNKTSKGYEVECIHCGKKKRATSSIFNLSKCSCQPAVDNIEDLDGEVWKDIKDWEGYYQVSNLGRIKKIFGKESMLMSLYDTGGYYGVSLRKPHYRKHYRVHRLIAEAFIPKIDGKDIINHKDGNRKNNSLSNLEWCTNEENIYHGFRVLEHGNMKLSMNDVNEIRSLKINGFSVKEIAKQYGVNEGVIYHLMHNRTYKTKDSQPLDFKNIIEDLDVNQFVGKKFGKLTVIEEVKRDNCSKRVKCRCECGNEDEYLLKTVLTHKVSMCNSCYGSEKKNNKVVNHTSFYFGIRRARKKWKLDFSINGKHMYLGLYKTQKDALEVLNNFYKENGFLDKIQNYEGEFYITNDEQRKVQEEWEKEHAKR